jgi:Leucine Rich repeat
MHNEPATTQQQQLERYIALLSRLRQNDISLTSVNCNEYFPTYDGTNQQITQLGEALEGSKNVQEVLIDYSLIACRSDSRDTSHEEDLCAEPWLRYLSSSVSLRVVEFKGALHQYDSEDDDGDDASRTGGSSNKRSRLSRTRRQQDYPRRTFSRISRVFQKMLNAMVGNKNAQLQELILTDVDLELTGSALYDLLVEMRQLRKLRIAFSYGDAVCLAKTGVDIAVGLTLNQSLHSIELVGLSEVTLTNWMRACKSNPRVTSLYLDASPNLDSLVGILSSRNTSVSRLHLDRMVMLPLDSLAAGLSNGNSCLRVLSVTKSGLNMSHVESIREVLTSARILEELNLEWNDIGNEGFASICDLLVSLDQPHLRILNMSQNGLQGVSACMTIGNVISGLASLQVLRVARNKIAVKRGLRRLCECLQQLARTMDELDLSGCRLNADFLRALIQEDDLHVKTLHLSYNGLDASSVDVFESVLSGASSLTGLVLSGNPLGDEGALNLVDILSRRSASGNGVAGEAADAAVTNVQLLEYLCLDDVNITCEGFSNILTLVRENGCVKSLSMKDNNRVSRVGMECLAEVLPHLYSLKAIRISWSDTFRRALESIEEGLESNSRLMNFDIMQGDKRIVSDRVETALFRNRLRSLWRGDDSSLSLWPRVLEQAYERQLVSVAFECLQSLMVSMGTVGRLIEDGAGGILGGSGVSNIDNGSGGGYGLSSSTQLSPPRKHGRD